MNEEEYTSMLNKAAASLASVAEAVHLLGEGSSRFLTATRGDRGLELYASDSNIIVDPAIGEELQGERSFRTLEEALRFASQWLMHKA